MIKCLIEQTLFKLIEKHMLPSSGKNTFMHDLQVIGIHNIGSVLERDKKFKVYTSKQLVLH